MTDESVSEINIAKDTAEYSTKLNEIVTPPVEGTSTMVSMAPTHPHESQLQEMQAPPEKGEKPSLEAMAMIYYLSKQAGGKLTLQQLQEPIKASITGITDEELRKWYDGMKAVSDAGGNAPATPEQASAWNDEMHKRAKAMEPQYPPLVETKKPTTIKDKIIQLFTRTGTSNAA